MIVSTVAIMLVVVSVRADILWGVNGHPLVSYPGVSPSRQLDLIQDMGMRSYRVDVTRLEHMERLASLIAGGRQRNIAILPVLIPPVDLKVDSEEDLYDKSFAFAQRFALRFPEIAVWELGNELENFAIIQPCEMRDDGTQYPCAWGPAGGVGTDEYYGPRYVKVASVLRGLSHGIRAANPKARRAIGSAGWGHVGIFARLKKDNVPWEISVWHHYEGDPRWGLEILATYGRPIWITEFNHSGGSHNGGEDAQAAGLDRMMTQIRGYAGPYGIEAAFIYELMDETYWAPSFEASMGLVRLVKDDAGRWSCGPTKAAYETVKRTILTGAASVETAPEPAR